MLPLLLFCALDSLPSQVPLEASGMFDGRKAATLRRSTAPSDWHPTQIAYGDGSATTTTAATVTRTTAAGATTVSPADFGGDPTGLKDSSSAFRAAIVALRALCKLVPGAPDNTSSSEASPHPRFDCGGAVLDLGGGWYSVTGARDAHVLVFFSGGEGVVQDGLTRWWCGAAAAIIITRRRRRACAHPSRAGKFARPRRDHYSGAGFQPQGCRQPDRVLRARGGTQLHGRLEAEGRLLIQCGGPAADNRRQEARRRVSVR